MPCLYRSLALTLMHVSAFSFCQAAAPQPASTAQIGSATSGSNPSASKVEMPSDPAALLELASNKNGLQNIAGPWHLKAEYEVMDEKGAVKVTGIFEEFWVSDTKYKKTYTSSSFNQTDYSTANGILRVGNPDWPTGAVALVERSLFPRFPMKQYLDKEKITLRAEHVNGEALSCVVVSPLKEKGGVPDKAYCFDQGAPAMRIAMELNGAYHVVYNEVRAFAGAYLAASTGVSIVGKPFLGVHVKSLETLPVIDEEVFAPPANAVPVNRRVTLEMSDMHIASPVPNRLLPSLGETPPHFEGRVVLRMVIGRDGRIQELEPLNISKQFLKLAVDQIKEETFKPHEKDGQAVDVEVLTLFAIGPPRVIN
jgi:hypothetical protein